MIQVQNLTKRYGAFTAIEQVTFEVEKGEILGFLGPNGAGKTTTMRILTCYMPANDGTAKVAGFDVFKDSMEVRRRIGYMPENPPVYFEMTVDSYLDFVAKIKGIQKKDRQKGIDRVKERCGIKEVGQDLIGRLSKGYKQRVGLAQALIHEPEVLILDEPTIGLDPRQVFEVRELIKSLSEEHTVILSTHVLPEVSMVCERVLIINKGRIVAEGTPEDLTKRLKGTETILVGVEGPIAEVEAKIKAIDGVVKLKREIVSDGNRAKLFIEGELEKNVLKDIASTIISNGWGLYELRTVEMSLEEIFLYLTTEEEVGE